MFLVLILMYFKNYVSHAYVTVYSVEKSGFTLTLPSSDRSVRS